MLIFFTQDISCWQTLNCKICSINDALEVLTDHLLIKSQGAVFYSFRTLGHKVIYIILRCLFKNLSKSPLKQPKYKRFKRCSASKILPCEFIHRLVFPAALSMRIRVCLLVPPLTLLQFLPFLAYL